MYRSLLLLAVALPALVLGGLVGDVDGDGLPTVEEAHFGTEAFAPDTDGDGLADGRELEIRTEPRVLDTDADGLADGRELELGTDPLAGDSDADGLDDAREADFGTNATSIDSDDDGLADDREVADDTDPTVADTDADGLSDGRELELGTDPLAGDSDGDGLTDGAEADRDTHPLDPDTDGDGFGDGAEAHRTDVLRGADPLRIDVYVEVDQVAGASLPGSEVGRVVSEFAEAPVGREGARGIALHVVYDETNLDDRGPVSVTGRPDEAGDETVTVGAYADDHHDYRSYGYHYLLVVPEVQDVAGAEVLGEAGDGEFVIQSEERPDVRGATLMHELGHSLGLDRDDFDGIDGYEYTAEEYPSVMNYNTGTEYYGYSAGDPFDDWTAIVDDLYVPNASEFEEAGAGGESGA